MKPIIVVATYNRPNSLKRLLNSLDNANYQENTEVQLVISIDFQDSKAHDECVVIANDFIWKFGTKKVVTHNVNLGLRKHILSCGDLSYLNGSVIVLEDDLFVSPFFYLYASQTLDYYKDTPEIGGVSLYNHKRNFNNFLPFEILETTSSVYFMQIASSWGQAWTSEQWSQFKIWYDQEPDLDEIFIPNYVKNWPDSSWLKYFMGYLVEKDKYFVYPKSSLSTNFGDSGTHNATNNTNSQVPLLMDYQSFVFSKFENSINKYDAFFEINTAVLKKLNVALQYFDFEVDLFGTKDLKKIKSQYLLTSKKLKKNEFVQSFGLDLRPMASNVVFNIEGGDIYLTEVKNIDNINLFVFENPKVYCYSYGQNNLEKYLNLIFNGIKKKLWKF